MIKRHVFTIERTPSFVLNDSKHPANVRYGFCKPFVKNKKVLDLACGNTRLDLHLKDAKEVLATDYNRKLIAELKESNSLANFKYECNILPNIPKEKFDVILCLEVIEHITKKEGLKAVKNIAKSLNTNGILILSTPNKKLWSPKTNFSLDKYHLHEYEYNEIFKLLKKDFDVESYGLYIKQNQLRMLKLFIEIISLFPKKVIEQASPWFIAAHAFVAALRSTTPEIKKMNNLNETLNFVFVCRKK